MFVHVHMQYTIVIEFYYVMNGPQRTACLARCKLITNNDNQLTDLPGFLIVAIEMLSQILWYTLIQQKSDAAARDAFAPNDAATTPVLQ